MTSVTIPPVGSRLSATNAATSQGPPRLRTYLLRLSLLVVGMMAMTACGGAGGSSSSSAGGQVPIKIGIYPGNIYSMQIFAAQSAGFLAKNHLNATLVSVAGGPAASAGMASNSLDVASFSPELALPAVQQGVHMHVVAGGTNLNWEILVSNTLADSPAYAAAQKSGYPGAVDILRGHTVGVVALNSNSDAILTASLADGGVAAADVKKVAVGLGTSAAAALGSNQIDALITATPTSSEILAQGKGKSLIDFRSNTIGPPSIKGRPYVAQWATDEFIHNNPAAVTDFQRAIAQTTLWLSDPANKTAVDALYQKEFPSPNLTQRIDSIVQDNRDVFIAYYDPAALDAFNAFDVKYGFLKSPIDVTQLIAPGTPPDAAAAQALGHP